MSKYENQAVCRGSVMLGTGCGTCEKCLDEIKSMLLPAAPGKVNRPKLVNDALENLHKAVERLSPNWDAMSPDWKEDAVNAALVRVRMAEISLIAVVIGMDQER